MRTFDTGATRDADNNKLDYEAFFSPLVSRRRAEFMHKYRVQPDGTMRDGDNWQKGIPIEAYRKSLRRHHEAVWLLSRGYAAYDENGNPYELEEELCALMFNAEGWLHELLKLKEYPKAF